MWGTVGNVNWELRALVKPTSAECRAYWTCDTVTSINKHDTKRGGETS